MKETIWAIIAAKDEEKHIAKVIKETKKYVHKIVVIDDGSNDKTAKVAKKEGALVLRHVVNLGKGAATVTGCDVAIKENASIIILLDADGQHEPKDIPRFIEKIKENDIVFGVRTKKKSMPKILKFGNWFISKVTLLFFKVNIADTQCGFRALKAKAYQKVRWESSQYSMESEMIANTGKKRLKYTSIPINTIYQDKYKGTTIIDGVKIVLNMLWWRLTK